MAWYKPEKRMLFSKNEKLCVWRVKEKFERPSITYYNDDSCWCFEMTVFHYNIYMRLDMKKP